MKNTPKRPYNLTQEGKNRVTENLPTERRFQPVHGLYAYERTNIYPRERCVALFGHEKCKNAPDNIRGCLVVEEMKKGVIESLLELDHLQAPYSRPLVYEFATSLCYLYIIDAYVGTVSPFETLPEGATDLQPVLKRRWTIAESLRRYAEALSITPKQMVDLGISVKQFKNYADRVQEIKQQDADV